MMDCFLLQSTAESRGSHGRARFAHGIVGIMTLGTLGQQPLTPPALATLAMSTQEEILLAVWMALPAKQERLVKADKFSLETHQRIAFVRVVAGETPKPTGTVFELKIAVLVFELPHRRIDNLRLVIMTVHAGEEPSFFNDRDALQYAKRRKALEDIRRGLQVELWLREDLPDLLAVTVL